MNAHSDPVDQSRRVKSLIRKAQAADLMLKDAAAVHFYPCGEIGGCLGATVAFEVAGARVEVQVSEAPGKPVILSSTPLHPHEADQVHN